MATSPSHALGQIIGYTMEQAFFELLIPVANDYSLYLDRQGPRVARGARRKVTWVDDKGNRHDLDFVLEKNGTEERIGSPAAFIESAWRRYTKHSVNKAGEIANALVPLRRTFRHDRPFLGALVGGEWTQGGIAHMESQGISVLSLPLDLLVSSFETAGVDVYFDENTSTAKMAEAVAHWGAIGPTGQDAVVGALMEAAAIRFEPFADRLREHLSRKVRCVRILPLHGTAHEAASVSEALAMLAAMEIAGPALEDLELIRVEIQVRYSNTDAIDASFSLVSEAILWLEQNYLDS